MSANDQFLLDQRLEARRKAQAPKTSTDDFFNVFVAELRTQDYQLPGPEHLQYGIVDGSQDCGIDGIYAFVNGMLVTDDFERVSVSRNPDLDLLVFQCKTSTSFSESPLEKLGMYLPEILRFDRDEMELRKYCNAALLSESKRFLDVYSKLLPKRPAIKIFLIYASKGDAPSQGVLDKGKICVRAVEATFRDADVTLEFLGCRELVDLARRPARIDRTLYVAEGPLASEEGDGYVCLVKLHRYYEFITDKATGRLDAALFEANVREHEGETDVNVEISETLTAAQGSNYDFWWLNNGVTIIGEEVNAPQGKQLYIEAPQIVNGLQTSTEVFKHFAGGGTGGERLILVRVVRASDARLRDKIVKATNSQNELPLSALRATEPFQHDLEEFLLARGYYDRRRNYSRTRGYDEKRVVSMQFAGHAVVASLFQRPDLCRLRGASLLNDDEWYNRIFHRDISLNMYQLTIRVLRDAQSAIISDKRVQGTSVEDWQYHVAMVIAILLTRKEAPTHADLGGMRVDYLDPARIIDALEIVSVEYSRAIPSGQSWTFEELSSDESVVQRILERSRSLLKSAHWHNWPYEPVQPEFAIRASDVFYERIRGVRR